MAGFDYGQLVGGLLSTGGSIFGAQKASEVAKKEAETAEKNNATALELARINQQTELMKLQGASAPTSGSSNQTLYIALGVGGVLILGLTIFAVTRK